MKKINFFLTSLCLSSCITAHAETIRIYNHNHHESLVVNYQTCFREFRSNSGLECLAEVQNLTIKAGQSYADITLPDYTEYARIINAYAFDENGAKKAYSEFPGEEDCKAFHHSPVTLIRQQNEILCDRSWG